MKKFCHKILKLTLCYKLFNVIFYLYNYIKECNYISDTLYSDAFKLVLKSYLHINIKKDWLGRLYGVVNPNINKDGQYDFNTTIIELDGDNTNNNESVKIWIYRQMHLIADLFKIHNLYNYISMDFKHVGPENADNYLLIFDITARKELVYHLKLFLKQFIVYLIIALIILFINIYI